MKNCNIVIDRGEMICEFEYHPKIIAAMKLLPARAWNPVRKAWTLPATATAADGLLKALRTVDVVINDEAGEFQALVLAHARRFQMIQNPPMAQPQSRTSSAKHQRFGTPAVAELDAEYLGWDMGSGKSKAIVDAVCAYELQQTIIIGPLIVVQRHWKSEFVKHGCRDVDVLVLDDQYSTAEKSRILARRLKNRERIPNPKPLIVVINLESAWREPLGPEYVAKDSSVRVNDGVILSTAWDLAVIDEAHRIKDPDGRASNFAGELRSVARRRTCLSGTPQPNSPLDLWSQFRFLDPAVLGTNFYAFRKKYCVMGGYKKKQVVAFRNLDELHARIAPYMHRVRKQDVLDLPELTITDIDVKLSQTARAHYISMESELVHQVEGGTIDLSNALVALVRLQQATSGYLVVKKDDGADDITGECKTEIREIDDSKIAALRELLSDLPSSEPFVVFCRFHHDIAKIAELCDSLHRPHFEISGKVKELQDWEESCDARKGAVCIVQIKAGGIGIDLTRSAYAAVYSMSFFEWDTYEQALARLHRRGQSRPVTIYRLICSDTIEVAIYSALIHKERLSLATIDRMLHNTRPCQQKETCDE